MGENEQIPRLFAYFEEGGKFYLVQEFIDGYDLTKEIYPGKRFTESRTIQLLTEILEVLKYVHQQNVIHRDLKPQNIMRRKSDGKIVLIDFGAVKEIKGLTVTNKGQTTKTIAVGTHGYMPTEQAAGKPKFCSDIYAVGMIGIEALTGVKPNQLNSDNSTGEIIWKNQVNVSLKLSLILDKMISDYWQNRYQNVDEVLVELDEFANSNIYNQSKQTTVVIKNNQPKNLNKKWIKIGLGIAFSITLVSIIIYNIPRKNEQLLQSSTVNNETKLNADYSRLEKLLAEGKWKEADMETENIMLQVAERTSEKWLDSVSISKFPCSDLKKIDQLWVEKSDGHFGFTVQKPIYLQTGNKPRTFQEEPYKLFGKTVGWYQNQRWLEYNELAFNLPENSPKGHLPAPHRERTSAGFAPYHYLMDKLIECNL